MQLRLRSLYVILLSIPTAAMGFLAACSSGDSTTNPDASDATTADVAKDNNTVDVAVDAPKDAGCTNDADLLTALPKDAGMLAPCLNCLGNPSDAGCGTDLVACNGDCVCRQTVITAVGCIMQGGTTTTCFAPALSSTDPTVTALVGCAVTTCKPECLGSGDAGPKDAAADSGPKDAAAD